MIQSVKFSNIMLDKELIIFNKYFHLKKEDNYTILYWDKPEQLTKESSLHYFYRAMRLALPRVNLYVLSNGRCEMYDQLEDKNTNLMILYESTDNVLRISPNSETSLNECDIGRIKEYHELVIDYYTTMVKCRKKKSFKMNEWGFSLDQYLQSCSSKQLEESIVHIITAIEAITTTGHEQVSYKASLNTSLLVSNDYKERMEVFDLLKKMYSIRSKVVHGDVISFVKAMAKEDIYDNYFRLKEILSNVLFKTYKVDKKEVQSRIQNALFNCSEILLKTSK